MRNINTSRKHPKPEPDQIIITFRLSCQANGNLITEATDCCSSSDGVATNIALPFWGFHSTRRVYGQVVKYSKKKKQETNKKDIQEFCRGCNDVKCIRNDSQQTSWCFLPFFALNRIWNSNCKSIFRAFRLTFNYSNKKKKQKKKTEKRRRKLQIQHTDTKSCCAILAFLRIWKFRHRLAFSIFAYCILLLLLCCCRVLSALCFLPFAFCFFRWLQQSVACKRSCLR